MGVSLLLILFSSAVGGCSGGAEEEHTFSMAALEGMPEEVLAAPKTVQQAYQFAVANPEIMKQVPCYCGCGAMGHTSNFACYISDVSADGTVTYDTHALGCSICVDITLDTMRLLDEGKSVAEILTYVDATYAQYGPSNIP
jgi:hypothetical protein